MITVARIPRERPPEPPGAAPVPLAAPPEPDAFLAAIAEYEANGPEPVNFRKAPAATARALVARWGGVLRLAGFPPGRVIALAKEIGREPVRYVNGKRDGGFVLTVSGRRIDLLEASDE